MKLRVAQSHLCNPIHGGRWNDPAEGAGNAVAGVVRHDQQDVGSALWRNDVGRPVGLRLRSVEADRAGERRWRRRKILAVDGCGGGWRARYAGSVLRKRRGDSDETEEQGTA